MGSVYDENLIDNVFFKEIQEHYCEILEKASGSNWIICIPRSSLFTKGKISRNDVLEHILVPNVNGEPHYHNLHQQDVNICNNLIRIKIGDVTNTVRLLFNEIFHVGKSKYSLWCIDGILNQKNYYHTADVFEINNLCDCIDILWTDNAELIIEIHNIVKSWILEYNISRLNLTKLKPVIKGLYEQCLKCIKSKEKIENKIKDVNFYNNVQISVETYMQFCLEKECLSALCVCVLDVETKFNKIVRNVQDISLRSFDISPDLYECLPLAKQELNQINKYYTVLEKVVCLKQTFDILSTETSKSILNTEHLLEIFIFLIIKSNIYNWVTNLVFIKKFRFSIKNTASENDFLIANLQAAIEYIKSGAVLNKYKIFDVDNNSSLDLAQNDNLKKLFLYISDNNLKEVKEFITNQNIDTNIKLCHPFCSCDKCENLIEIKMCNINSSNDRGLTALHVAGICGNPDIVDFLISKGANLDSVDTAGFTPLHYAVSKGHQHITFLMLHSGSNINASDNEGNTPLHIATKNGHENCVKALIYFSKHLSYDVYINCVNNLGNTPLHFAAKFGYVSLVKLLIQNGAKIIKNKRKFTPEHVAHNYLVMRFLAHAEIEENSVAEQRVERRKKSSLQQNAIKEKSSDSCLRNSLDVSELRLKAENEGVKRRVSFCFDRDYHNQRKLIDFGVRPKNVDQFKKVDLLLKAVENNDLPLTCFYLGIPLPNVTDNIHSTCHPLCTCEKCSDEFIEKEVDETAAQLEHLNINICNSNGYTAIHFAAKYGRTEILRLLLDAGALINLKTYETFYTPLHLACMHQRIQIARELLKCGSCITDVADFKGNTPLHHACLKNDSRLFELLLSQGGDVTIKNNDGKTVLNTAKDKMFFNIVKILVPNNVHSSDFDIV